MKEIILNCGIKKNGLGNRLTTICSGYAISKINNMKPLLLWEPTFGCRASFEQLYKPIEGLDLIDPSYARNIDEDETFTGWDFSVKRCLQKHLKWLDKGFTDEYWQLYKECAQKIKLKQSLEDRMPKRNNFTSIHVRGNWQTRAPAPEMINQIVNFKIEDVFLSTDNKEVFNYLIENSKFKIWHSSRPKSNGDYMNRDLISQEDAAIDMMILTKSNFIITLGGPSSFRNLAVIGHGVPALRMDIGHSP